MVSSAFQESKTVPGIYLKMVGCMQEMTTRDQFKDKHDKDIHIRQKLLIFGTIFWLSFIYVVFHTNVQNIKLK